jgi:hypothetical protein
LIEVGVELVPWVANHQAHFSCRHGRLFLLYPSELVLEVSIVYRVAFRRVEGGNAV